MPNNPSAAKRLRQSKVRTARNRSIKSALKTHVKKVVSATIAGKLDDAESNFRVAAKKLDQASSKGVIHKNKAARQKSRMQRAMKAAKNVG
jgi:small subunit ribosomal protein S20